MDAPADPPATDDPSPAMNEVSDRDTERVLLLVERGTDRDLLGEELGDRYDVLRPAGDDLPGQSFDLAVIDGGGQRAFGEALMERKAAEEPVFLPILRLLGSDAGTNVPPELHEWADDVARLPLSRAELRGRVENLLRCRRLALQSRRQAERLEEFASVVAHDLRSPLNVASGYVETARSSGDVSRLDAAADALDRSARLIDDILTVARQGASGIDVQSVDLGEAVEGAWSCVDTGDASVSVETSATVRADPSRLQEALENLVRNAVEHGSTDGRTQSRDAGLTVTVGDLPDSEGFFVEDDGRGLPEDRNDLFEHGVSTTATGTGFGLSIVEGIASLHGWEVRATAAETGGARFELTGVEAAGGA